MRFADTRIFFPEINRFGYIKKHRYRLHFETSFLILLTFFESLKIILINMVTILMTLDSLDSRTRLDLRNKGYDVIIFIYDLTNKMLSRSSSYTVDVVT